jgi:hypothetical protein
MGKLQKYRKEVKIGDALAVASHGDRLYVGDHSRVHLVMVGDNTAALTIKITGTLRKDAVVLFTSAAAVGNEWDYIASYNLNDPSAVVTGDTGYTFAGDVVEQVIVNTNHLEYMSVEVTARTTGDVTVYAVLVDNE